MLSIFLLNSALIQVFNFQFSVWFLSLTELTRNGKIEKKKTLFPLMSED